MDGKIHPYNLWAALFCRSLTENLTFPEDLYVGEDSFFFAQALKNAKKSVYVNEVYYYYRFHTKSNAHSSFSFKQATEVLAWERIAELYNDHSEAFRNECEVVIAKRCKKVYLKAVSSGDPDADMLRVLRLKTRKRWRNIFLSSEMNQKAKILFAAFMVFPKSYTRYCWKKAPEN